MIVPTLIEFVFSSLFLAYADSEGVEQFNQSLADLLAQLDLGELDKYLLENPDSFLFDFGDNSHSIINYLLNGNVGIEYSSYLNEIFAVIFSDVVKLIPTYACILGVALLAAISNSVQGSILGKSTGKVVRLACFSLVVTLMSASLIQVISVCGDSVMNMKKQIEIITPILATLTVLTGGVGAAAIYQPSAIFLAGGAISVISEFVFPAAVCVIILDFLSRFSENMSFTGVSALIKSVMKWAIGITVTVFSVFISSQSISSNLLDGIIFKATKYAVSSSVPIVGGFIAGGLDMLTAAGLAIKSSVGICGIVLAVSTLIQPVVLLISLSLILKGVGAIVQPLGENNLFNMFTDISKDVDYFIAGILTIAFMYILLIMLVVNSAVAYL